MLKVAPRFVYKLCLGGGSFISRVFYDRRRAFSAVFMHSQTAWQMRFISAVAPVFSTASTGPITTTMYINKLFREEPR